MLLPLAKNSNLTSLVNGLRLCRFPDCLLVFIWHLPADLGDHTRCVPVILSNLSEQLYEIRYLDVTLLFRRLNSQQRWLLVHVQECLNHEVLAFIDETLAEFLQFDETSRCLLQHLDVLPGCQWSLFEDTLISDVLSHLMRVDVRVILAYLSNEVLSRVFGRLQEGLIDLKDLLFDLFGRVYVKHAWQGDQQELLMMRLGRR